MAVWVPTSDCRLREPTLVDATTQFNFLRCCHSFLPLYPYTMAALVVSFVFWWVFVILYRYFSVGYDPCGWTASWLSVLCYRLPINIIIRYFDSLIMTSPCKGKAYCFHAHPFHGGGLVTVQGLEWFNEENGYTISGCCTYRQVQSCLPGSNGGAY